MKLQEMIFSRVHKFFVRGYYLQFTCSLARHWVLDSAKTLKTT